jgi:hypothetical protein
MNYRSNAPSPEKTGAEVNFDSEFKNIVEKHIRDESKAKEEQLHPSVSISSKNNQIDSKKAPYNKLPYIGSIRQNMKDADRNKIIRQTKHADSSNNSISGGSASEDKISPNFAQNEGKMEK